MSRRWIDPSLRYGQLRRSQSIAPFGVGSILDLPNESLMPVSVDYWQKQLGVPIYDERLQKRLGVSYFNMVPSQDEFPDGGVPFTRFPKWLFCPVGKCRSLRRIDDWIARYRNRHGRIWDVPRCDICGAKLVPSRFIVACERGHIDDFPWIWWTHRGNSCPDPDLIIRTGVSSSGLTGIRIECRSCEAKNTMAGAFGKDAHSECSGHMPWSGKYEACDSMPRTLQRGASNVYFPQVINPIVIPSYTDSIRRAIRETSEWDVLVRQESLDDSVFEWFVGRISEQISRDVNEVRSAIVRMRSNSVEPMVCSEIDYRYDEYRVFQGHEEDLASHGDLELQLIAGVNYRIHGIKSVTLVHRLREVRALVAFSRLHPLDRHEIPEEDNKAANVYAVPVRGKRQGNWLPGVEVRGEGVFLGFDQGALGGWETNPPVVRRAEILNIRYQEMAEERGFSPRVITPRFILLHTLAHLLIRQLAFECGYGSASLRERIYCNETPNQPYMAGILIYTASGDADGTLGGLVRQGRPDFLSDLVSKAVTSGYWCSSDPLCIESQGQGLGSLNLAACHACALLPETSCEEFNRLLDRALVVGLPEEPEVGFLSSMIHP